MSYKVTKPSKPLNVIIMDVLDKAVAPRLKQDVKAIADDVRQKLVDKIQDDSFDFPDFSKKYAARKEKEHPGEPPLVATEEYINSIVVEETPYGYTVGVGDAVHMGEKGHSIPMKQLANILEYGSPAQNIRPRPHWRPALANLRRRRRNMTDEMMKQATKDAQAALNIHLNQQTKSSG